MIFQFYICICWQVVIELLNDSSIRKNKIINYDIDFKNYSKYIGISVKYFISEYESGIWFKW